MKKEFLAIIFFSLFYFTGCGDSFFSAQNYLTGPVDGVGLKNATSIMEGNSEQLFAVVTPSKTKNKDVTWSSSDIKVASVDSSGLVTAAGVGKAFISVTTVEGGYKDTCEVTVTVRPVPVKSITLSKNSAWIFTGDNEQLSTEISPVNATNQNLIWSSEDAAIAAVDAAGLVTARTSGAVKITAETVDGGYKASCIFNVTDAPVPVTGLTLNKQVTVVETGNSERLYTSITPFNATTADVAWSSSNESVARVNSFGTVTGVTEGTARITATSIDGSFSAYCDCSIVSATVNVTGVVLNKTNTMILSGYTEQLSAVLTPSNATNQNLLWSSNKSSVAAVDSSGTVTGMSEGSAVITVTTVDGGKTSSCTCVISSAAVSVESVSLNKGNTIIETGKSEQLYASITPFLAGNKKVIWSSSNSAIASVDSSGIVSGLKSGTATVTVTTVDGGKTASCSCLVTAGVVAVQGVDIPSSLIIERGTSAPLSLAFIPSSATSRTVTWSSNNSQVASVDSSGVVTGLSGGSAVITVQSDDGGKTDTCNVTVDVIAESVALNPVPFTISAKGDISIINVNYTPAGATTGLVSDWKSLNPEIATVDATGKVTGVSFGTAQIVATYCSGKKTAVCEITVDGFRLKYNSNGGAGEPPASKMFQSGETVTVAGHGTLVKSNCSFKGWCENADGTGLIYGEGDTFIMTNSAKTLYAKWIPDMCRILFYPNGGNSGTMDAQSMEPGSWANLTLNAYARPGYTFAGWATTASGAVAYGDGVNYNIGDTDVSLYARWTPNNNHIVFNSSNGTGSMTDQIVPSGDTVTLKINTFTKSGFTFLGWATDAGSQSPVAYTDGASLTMGVTGVTLYAKWASNTVYTLRSTGPAGGIVFYDKGNYNGGWRYLEAAPAGWNSGGADPTIVWSNILTQLGGTSAAIGAGWNNTILIINQAGHTTSAALACRNYTGGGYSDWFLPSTDELIKIYVNLRRGTDDDAGNSTYTPISGFNAWGYWSSQEGGNVGYLQVSSDGSISITDKTSDSYMGTRPVRAF